MLAPVETALVEGALVEVALVELVLLALAVPVPVLRMVLRPSGRHHRGFPRPVAGFRQPNV